MTRLRLRPSQFEHGDRLSDGATVLGKDFIRGGVRVYVRLPDDAHETRIFNGRFKFEIEREGDE